MAKRVHVIINPSGGQDRPILGPMNRAFAPAGIDWEVLITKQAGDARRFAQEAARAGVDAVGVYGGDGTVMEVASGLVGTRVPLAIFPGGTANVMSVELGIPSDLAEAMALVCEEECATRLVDMGKIGDGYFLLRVGVGFEAEMVEGADRELKDKLGVLAYGVSAVQALREPAVSRYRIRIDDREVETEGMTCIIANTGSFGKIGLMLAPTIDVSDGCLDVIVVRKADVPSLLSVAASLVAGNERAEPLQHWQGRAIRVEADPPQPVQVDGEVLGESPVEATVLPGAVKVIVPRTTRELGPHTGSSGGAR
jgi:YegS/Rv2252/BmrU family lipid kinase